MSMPDEMGPVSVRLSPAARRRLALLHDAAAITEDLVAVLKTKVDG
jgi:hypothetical protein